MYTLSIGFAYRPVFGQWADVSGVDFLEIQAADYLKSRRRLERLAQDRRLSIRGGRQSLGTPGELNAGELFWFSQIVERADPIWISEPAAFSRSSEIDLEWPNPVCASPASVSVIADHARRVMEVCRKPLLLENVASHLRVRGSLRETEFLNRVCEVWGCGLLLDLSAVFVNSQNQGFSPRSWMQELDPGRIVVVRAGSWTKRNGRFLTDAQDRIAPEVWDLLRYVLTHAEPRAVILESDGLPATPQMESQLRKVKAMTARPSPSSRKTG